MKIKMLEERDRAQEASPFCPAHFPKGGVRCYECLKKQMTPEQTAHRDVQATLFGTPLPLRGMFLHPNRRYYSDIIKCYTILHTHPVSLTSLFTYYTSFYPILSYSRRRNET